MCRIYDFGVSENRGLECNTLDTRILMIRTPLGFRVKRLGLRL